MGEKRTVEVLIGGEVYKIVGTESEEHMKKVAQYLNDRLAETQQALGGRPTTKEHRLTLTAINICDDVIKLVEHAHQQERFIGELQKKEREMKGQLAVAEDRMREMETEYLALKEEMKNASCS